MQIRTVNKYFAEKEIPLELVRGDGYHYFVYDSGKIYETHSVYVYRLNQLSLAQWIEAGEGFLDIIEDKFEDRIH